LSAEDSYMRSDPSRALRAAIAALWDARLNNLAARALGLGKTRFGAKGPVPAELAREAVKDAYLAGYRQAYWDGVADLIQAGGDLDSPECPLFDEHLPGRRASIRPN